MSLPSAALPAVNNQAPPTGRCKSVILVGNPNSGKSTLFNRLTGLVSKTANYPGTTVDVRKGGLRFVKDVASEISLIDSPGIYGLESSSPEELVTRELLLNSTPPPDQVVHVIDATHLQRGLPLAFQVIELGISTIVVLSMFDIARKRGIEINVVALSEELGCRVIPVSSRTGENLAELAQLILGDSPRLPSLSVMPSEAATPCTTCHSCPYAARFDRAETMSRRVVNVTSGGESVELSLVDRWLTGRWVGLGVFAAVMLTMFALIFWLADYPMTWLDGLVGSLSTLVQSWVPNGILQNLLTDGIITGVGGILVFVPQIFILFFVISLLEETGYLARAACVMDRWMQRVGLPGKAFVPLVAAHACAIPAVMASRVIDDPRDRLKTILIIPLLSCSARVPVYSMVVALLFPSAPIAAALTFAAAYAIAVIAALTIGWVFKQTILPGDVKPLLIELPEYRVPSIRSSLAVSWERSLAFVRNAGTVILLFSMGLWCLATFPQARPEQLSSQWQARIQAAVEDRDPLAEGRLAAQAQVEYSFAGRIGKMVQPVFAPLGFDWRLSVGVLNSFAAREVIVSTLAILYGSSDEEAGLLGSLQRARDASGQRVFTIPTCLSLLVFYIFAMQCFPTLAVIRRELGGWKWPMFQLAYMSILAYVAALGTFQLARLLT